ncbi:hypothetical protein THTE_0464 [Thermogutta terrifontis]|uniref:Uncharacterized protein n=1 Tax=Thermogutta terrifontis TaxID=1331910 RepID=A0A286RAT1_9BACT|nr:hypothetical protein THTE_0464 [Thermogutta terrifontis]
METGKADATSTSLRKRIVREIRPGSLWEGHACRARGKPRPADKKRKTGFLRTLLAAFAPG